MGYVFLGLAIVGEVIATTFLKVSSADRAPWWTYAVVGVGYIFAFAMLSQTLAKGVPLGTAYAIWAGVGVVLVAVISWQQILGMALVAGGVVLLEAGGKHA
jgi:small multidrug resistance pump